MTTEQTIKSFLKIHPQVLSAMGEGLHERLANAGFQSISTRDCADFLFHSIHESKPITSIYEQLQNLLGVKIQPAPDQWDRLYNVDFFIEVAGKFIGIQIKPVHQGIQLAQIFKEKSLQKATHEKFAKKYGGNVFYIFSANTDGKKTIVNQEVIGELRTEIARLTNQ